MVGSRRPLSLPHPKGRLDVRRATALTPWESWSWASEIYVCLSLRCCCPKWNGERVRRSRAPNRPGTRVRRLSQVKTMARHLTTNSQASSSQYVRNRTANANRVMMVKFIDSKKVISYGTYVAVVSSYPTLKRMLSMHDRGTVYPVSSREPRPGTVPMSRHGVPGGECRF